MLNAKRRDGSGAVLVQLLTIVLLRVCACACARGGAFREVERVRISEAIKAQIESVPCVSVGDLPWNCVYTLPQSEIASARKLAAEGCGVFLPRVAEYAPSKGIRVSVLFPRYLFCQVAGERVRRGHRIYSAVGCELGSLLLSAGSTRPVRVPDVVLGELWARCDLHGVWEAPKARPAGVGDRVTIAGGPYDGWSGVVSLSRADRVAVLLSALGGSVPVLVPRDAVKTAAR